MEPPHDETADLLRRWHDGEAEAVHALLQRDQEWIYERVRQRRGHALRDQAETMDDFQDLVVRVLRYSPKFVTANRRQFRGLMARIIENLLADRANRLQRYREERLGLGDSRISFDPAIVDDATRPDAAAERSESLAWLQIGLEFLEPDDRDLIWQRHFEDRSFVEIGQATGLQPDAVRMRVSRALLQVAGIIERLQRGELDGLLDESEHRAE